mgnify:CR=1 FL=1
MLSIGWFSTGRGEGSQGLLRFIQERIRRGCLEARIEFVFSNREPGESEGSDRYFQSVRDYGLSLEALSSAKFRRTKSGSFAQNREEFDSLVIDRLKGFRPDICVLAGYMLIAGRTMCQRYSLLNLHPALPDGPTGTWQEVIWELIAGRASQTGAMVHLATEQVDRGPVISHCTVPIIGGEFEQHWKTLLGRDIGQIKRAEGENLPMFQLIRQAEYRKEPYLLSETLRAVAGGKGLVKEGRVLDTTGRPLTCSEFQGLNLDAEIEISMDSEVANRNQPV